MEKKGNYGLDGPHYILGFGLTVVFALGGALTAIELPLKGTYITASEWIFISVAFYSALIFSLMVYYSKVGKLRFAQQVIDELEIQGDEKILDVGCGRGLYLNYLAKRVTEGRVYGIDIWQKKDLSGNSRTATLLNAEIEKVLDRIDVVDADMRSIPFEDNHFDLIVSCLAIHNVPSKKGRETAIQEIARVTKPGGIIKLIDFQFLPMHAEILEELGWKEVLISPLHYSIFPPMRVLSGIKPFS